jgi:phage recombination protein Bet
MSTAVAKKTAVPAVAQSAVQGRVSLMARIADRYAVDPDKMKSTLIATAFRLKGKEGKPAPTVSDEQLMMLLVVADQYKLNPFTREIYAFPSEGGIVAIVSVDGWIRIINERPELRCITFAMAPAGTEDPWISCTIERKDRSRPTTITEFLSECARNTDPWNQMPRRMLRHKALIQCARVAFGFAGIFDPDEGERIVSVIEQPTRRPEDSGKPETRAPKARIKQDDKPPQTEPAVTKIGIDQATQLRDRLHEEGIEVTLLCAAFEIGDVEDLAADSFDVAQHWIDQQSATP